MDKEVHEIQKLSNRNPQRSMLPDLQVPWGAFPAAGQPPLVMPSTASTSVLDFHRAPVLDILCPPPP